MMSIIAKGLTKKFGEKLALDNIHLEIEKGKILKCALCQDSFLTFFKVVS